MTTSKELEAFKLLDRALLVGLPDVPAEDLGRIRQTVFSVIWEQGAKDASLSLDHGGHNATNPYKED